MVQHSTLLKTLALSALALTVFAALGAGVLLVFGLSGRGDTLEPCMTEGCLRQAAHAKAAMDESVDPCDDFYRFACGNWIKNTVPQRYDTSWRMYTKVLEDGENRKGFVINEWDKANETDLEDYELKTLAYYRSCINETSREELDLLRFMDFTKAIGIKFTILGMEGIGDIAKADKMFVNKTLDSALYSLDVNENIPTEHTLKIAPPVYTVNLDYYTTSKDQKFTEYVVEVFTAVAEELGDQVGASTKQQIRSRAEDVAKFELALVNITCVNSNWGMEFIYDEWVIGDLNELTAEAPTISWKETLHMLFAGFNVDVNSTFPIRIQDPDFFPAFQSLMETVDSETVLNYMLWTLLREALEYMPQKFDDMRTKFKYFMKEEEMPPPTESKVDRCIHELSSAPVMEHCMAAGLVKHFFSKQSFEKFPMMIEGIEEAFLDNIETLDWLDEESRQRAIIKMKNMDFKFGFPETLNNLTFVNNLLSEVNIEDNKFFNNFLQLRKTQRRNILGKLNQPIDREAFLRVPHHVNAFYYPMQNKIRFLAGLLQSPIYVEPSHDAFVFGAAGVITGHEIGHGFDSDGVNFDEIGRYHTWMSNASSKAYEELTECYVNQYNKFEIHGRHNNGVKTLGENIADNFGLELAFKVYEKHQRKNRQPPLPGVDLNWKQMYFLAFAHFYCQIPDKDFDIEKMNTDFHSLGKFRVWGSVQNSRDFADAYNCRENAPMNPVDKCQLW